MAKISNLDFYAILGVHPNAEDIVIRAAFKALAQRYHPDRFNGAKDEAHRRMADREQPVRKIPHSNPIWQTSLEPSPSMPIQFEQ